MKQQPEGFYWALFPNAGLDIAYWIATTGLWRKSNGQLQRDDDGIITVGAQLTPPAIPTSPTADILSAAGGLGKADIAALLSSGSPALRALGTAVAATAAPASPGVSGTVTP